MFGGMLYGINLVGIGSVEDDWIQTGIYNKEYGLCVSYPYERWTYDTKCRYMESDLLFVSAVPTTFEW